MNFKEKCDDNFFIESDKKLMEVLSLIAAIVTPGFVLACLKLNPNMPLILKLVAWVVALIFIVPYCSIYISSFVKEYLSMFFYLGCYLASGFAIYLLYFNDFSEGYCLIFILVVFYITLTFDKIRSLLFYLISIISLVSLSVYFDRMRDYGYDNNSFIVIMCLTVLSIIVLLNLSIRESHKKALNESRKDYQRLLDVSPDGIIVCEGGKIIYANEAIARIFQAEDKDKLVGKPIFKFLDPREYKHTIIGIKKIIKNNDTDYVEEILNLSNNASIHVEMANILTTYNGKNAIMTIVRDISKRKKMEDRINQMAHYDSVTGLPNRYFLNMYLQNAIETCRNNGQSTAIMFIDLDRFKIINDTMGHNFGDVVLQKAASEIKSCLDESDFISRYGGDEFIVVLENKCFERSKQIAKGIIDAFSNSLNIGEHMVDITPSIGISFYPKDGENAENLIKYADTAMYEAKSQGRNNYKFYTPEMNLAVSRSMVIESALRKALRNEEFMIHYQPQIDLNSREISGVEALIRWKHPELGTISPSEFIPLAEETGLIVPIGEWVLRKACTQNKIWQSSGMRPINIAVNVSYQQLKYYGFVDCIKKVLSESGLEAKYLELEITETILKDIEELKYVLNELEPLGVKLSVDDFGVGYSSLSVLQNISINNLKIDMSFIKNMIDNSKSAAIVKTIINMGKNLNCNVIAEGVETKEQAEFLRKNSCNIAQGYLFSRPIEAEELEKLINNWK
ncbi:diguanylate cyclase domain protein [Clostridiales bacterium oral taxon 876 str. F0540]|nr:diguanylate cyclase domain protein [Clostridiales bacterium oral taxon 876 str. F0540]